MYGYATTCSRFSFLRFDLEHTQDETLHLDCFCEVASGIEVFWLNQSLCQELFIDVHYTLHTGRWIFDIFCMIATE